jgi:hypothetical protein
LTAWKTPGAPEPYVSACAESGDFAEAVKWQTKAMEFKDRPEWRGADMQKCLELHEAKKPDCIPPMTAS